MANGPGGGGAGPSNDQLKIAQQMFAVLEQMKVRAEKISEAFETQAQATARMAENFEGMSTGEVVTQLVEVNKTLKEVVAALQTLGQTATISFQQVSEGATEAATSTQTLSGAVEQAGQAAASSSSNFDSLRSAISSTGGGTKGLKKQLSSIGDYLTDEFPVAAGAALGALDGLKQGFKNLTAMGSGILGFASSLISSFFEIGKAIIAIPFKMFGALVEMANSAAGGVSELAEAINNLRKEFGALTGPTNTAIMGLSKSMSSLKIGGLSATLAFGNMADRIKLMTELFTQGGAAIRSFTQEIVDSNGAILAYQKGLGISNEEMGTLASYAKRDGKSLTSVLNNITKQADAMGKKFGLDSKIISKGMAKAASDMAHFGHMSEKQLGVAVTYASKLGLEIDKIAGGLDQFTNFEDAAENVSALNAQFGTNIDLNEVMAAQTPDEIFQTLRKGMQDAGVSLDKLDFRQRKYIKQLTGWEDAALNAALSTSNMAVNLNDMKKEGDKAEKKVMSQEEAMGKLADAIDRVYKSGGERPKSFWEAFTKGFEKGIMMIPEFRTLMGNIVKSTNQFYKAGMSMAKVFYEHFPGVQKIVKGLTDLFDPSRIGGMLDGIIDKIKNFMKKLKKGDASFKEMMEELKEEFFNFFRKSGPGADTLMQGFKEFFEAIKMIFAGALEWVMTKAGELINSVVELISNPPNLSGVGEGAEKVLSPIAEAFKNGWAVLGPALNNLFKVLFKKLGEVVVPLVTDFAKEYWPIIAAALFGPALGKAFLGAGSAALASAVGGMLKKAISGPDVQQQILSAVQNLGQVAQQGAPPTGPMLPPAPAVANDAASAQAMGAAKGINWGAVGTFLIGFAGVMAIGLVTFYVAAQMVEDMSTETILKALGVMLATALAAIPVAVTLQMLQKAPAPNPAALTQSIIAITAVMAVLGLLGVGLAYVANLVPLSGVIKGSIIILTMALSAVIVGAALWLILPAAGAVADGGVTLSIAVLALSLAMVLLTGLGIILASVSKDIDMEGIKKGALAIVIISAAAVMASLAMIAMMAAGVAALFGGAIAIMAAIVMIKEVLGELVDLGTSMIEKTSSVPVSQMKKAGDVIVEAAKIVGVAALAVIALALTGGLLLLGGALGAGGLLVGFAAVKEILGDKEGGLVGLSITISKEVAKMPKDLASKAEAFAKILEAVASIMQVIPQTLESMDFGWFETSSEQQAKINKTTEMINSLIGQKGTGKGVIGIIETIIEQIKSLPMSAIKKAESIGPVLQGAAGIATALGSSSSLSSAFENIDDDDFEKLGPIIDKMGDITKVIGTGIQDVLKGLIPVIEAAKGIKGKDAEGIKAVASLMQALGPIAQSLAPPPEAMNMLSKLAEEDDDEVAAVMDSLGDYVSKVGKTLSQPGGIIDGIKGTIVTIINALKGLSISESSAKALEAIGPIISTIVEFVSSMAKPQQESSSGDFLASITGGDKFSHSLDDISWFIGKVLAKMSEHIPKLISGIAGGLASAIKQLSPEQVALFEPLGKIIESLIKLVTSLIPPPSTPPPPPKEALDKGGTIIYNISNSAPDIGAMLTSLGRSIPQLVDIIVKEAQKVGKIKGIEKELDLLLKLFDVLPKLAGIIDATKNFQNEEGKADPSVVDTIVQKVGLMKTFLSRILNGPIPEIIDVIQSAAPKLKGLDKVDKTAESLSKGFGALKNLMTSIKDVIATLAQKDEEGGDVDIATVGGEIATKVQKMSGFLTTIAESVGPLFSAQDKIAKLLGSSSDSDISGISARILGTAEMFQELMNSELIKGAEGSVKNVETLQNLIGKGIVPSVKAAEDMVKMAKKLEDAMGQGLKIDLDAKLQAFASKFGKVGSAGAYTVQARDVNIHVKFNVSMDAQSIEKIMITNASSVIKNRLNLLIDATKDGSDGDTARTSLQSSGKIQPGGPVSNLPGG